jgi:hypothetical protein
MKKYWIDNSEGHPVMMTTDGKMSWREACKVSWEGCTKEPNITLYLVLGIVAVVAVLVYLLHSFIA